MEREITKDDKNQMRPKFALIVRTHGLPKIHKQIVKVLFGQIWTQQNGPHYRVKFLTNLLHS